MQLHPVQIYNEPTKKCTKIFDFLAFQYLYMICLNFVIFITINKMKWNETVYTCILETRNISKNKFQNSHANSKIEHFYPCWVWWSESIYLIVSVNWLNLVGEQCSDAEKWQFPILTHVCAKTRSIHSLSHIPTHNKHIKSIYSSTIKLLHELIRPLHRFQLNHWH